MDDTPQADDPYTRATPWRRLAFPGRGAVTAPARRATLLLNATAENVLRVWDDVDQIFGQALERQERKVSLAPSVRAGVFRLASGARTHSAPAFGFHCHRTLGSTRDVQVTAGRRLLLVSGEPASAADRLTDALDAIDDLELALETSETAKQMFERTAAIVREALDLDWVRVLPKNWTAGPPLVVTRSGVVSPSNQPDETVAWAMRRSNPSAFPGAGVGARRVFSIVRTGGQVMAVIDCAPDPRASLLGNALAAAARDLLAIRLAESSGETDKRAVARSEALLRAMALGAWRAEREARWDAESIKQGKPQAVRPRKTRLTLEEADLEFDRIRLAELEHRNRNRAAIMRALAVRDQNAGEDLGGEHASWRWSRRLGEIAAAERLAFAHPGEAILDLRGLLSAAVEPFRSARQQVDIVGPDVQLAPVTAEALALVLHELATNAVKHGSLGVPEGSLTISWRKHRDGQIALSWCERGGPPPRQAQQERGGSRLLKDVVVGRLAGEVSREIDELGLWLEITLPPSSLGSVDDQIGGAPQHSAPPASFSALIVEDEPVIAMDLEGRLRRLGASRVEIVQTTEDAFRLIDATPFDIALLDLNIGDETTSPLADHLASRSLAFAFVTGSIEPLPQRHAHRPLIPKPYDDHCVADAVAALLPRGKD